MDAQSRGRADDFDPADQWVLNPQTGNYELRLDHSPPQSPPAAPPADPMGQVPPDVPDTSWEPRTPGPRDAPDNHRASPQTPEVPPQRSRRSGGRAANRSGGRSGGASGGAAGGTNPPAAGRRKRKQSASRKKKALMWTGGVLGFVVVAGSVGAYLVYERLNSNLSTIDVAGAGSGGFKKDQAVNILVIGTDKRTGKGNTSYGDRESPGHADTTILFHVSKDRTNATALSIPRDLIMDIPSCETKTEDGTKLIPGSPGTRFNESLGQEGRDPGCTMSAVKELTGITVDHFMMADFNAVKTMTTAIDGVEVCLAKDIDDKDSKLKLPAGTHTLEGEEALAFVRTRHSVGFGGDLSRIEIQQQFLSSMIRKMKSSDTLTSPTKMLDLADAATKALTVDTGIGSIKKLQELGMELADVNPENITFTTVPVIDNTDKATVLLNEAKAKPLFTMIQNDISLTEVKQKEKDAKNAQKRLLKGPRAQASEVRVRVFNGSDTPGAALTTLTWLQNEQGVLKASNEGNAPENLRKTTLEYGPDQANQARKLADLMGLPARAMKQGTKDAGALEAMTLTLGADFKGAGVPIAGPGKTPDGVKKVSADKQVCAK
ncbi:LCP family protein [Streptomyces katsurahamanus]|uniref:LytR family transcriptional regulator n=1 Tax=Streptomyces katsurahamanus TaxID=2577098 RepID=A0ABW9NMA7_9ACTN|nr:LCP family protein [Streptomyces katsurahamanus]MQS34452.1 LytR family transcriptional regulator [Streptomyces katsurahamanus]